MDDLATTHVSSHGIKVVATIQGVLHVLNEDEARNLRDQLNDGLTALATRRMAGSWPRDAA